MPAIGGYALHLYCDNDKNTDDVWDGVHEYGRPLELTGCNFSECRREARQLGWVFHKDKTVSCPKCSGKAPSE